MLIFVIDIDDLLYGDVSTNFHDIRGLYVFASAVVIDCDVLQKAITELKLGL